MFLGKRKLLREGTEAQAVVLDCDIGGLQNSHGEDRVKLELRVHYEDGSTAELTCHSWAVGAVSTFQAGDIVPVRYDPNDREKVALDRDAIRAGKDARREKAKRDLAELAEQKLAGRPSAPPGA